MDYGEYTMSRRDEKRFWAKVEKTDGCWKWTGVPNGRGYGTFYVEGDVIGVHRISWMLANGQIPGGAKILHECDNRICVNPAHLDIGTTRLNAHDMTTRNRGRKNGAGSPGSMYERKPGVWVLRASIGRDPETGIYRQTSRTFKGSERQAAIELGRLVAEVQERQTVNVGTVSHLLEEWLTRASPSLEALSIRDYRGNMDRYLLPVLGDVKLKKLTAEHFDQLYADLATGKRRKYTPAGAEIPGSLRVGMNPLSPRTIKGAHATASAALNQAVKWRWLPYSPTDHAKKPKIRKSELIMPTLAQFEQIVEQARKDDPDMAVMLMLALLLGGRRSEIVGLRWRDVYEDHVTIRRAIVDDGGKVLEKDPKSHAIRTVGIDPGPRAMLAQLRARLEERAATYGTAIDPAGFVFSREPDCSLPMRPEWVSAAYRNASRAAGVDAGPLKQLRHLSITLRLAAGVPIEEVSADAGHAKQSTTWDFYSGHVPGRERQGPAILAGLLGYRNNVSDESDGPRAIEG